MATPLEAYADLHRAAPILAASGDPAGQRVAERLAIYFEQAPHGMTIEVALELTSFDAMPRLPNHRRAARDALLIAIAARHFPDSSVPQAAREIDKEWRQYCRCRRDHDLKRGHSKDPAGSLDAALFDLATLGRVPQKKQISNILRAAESPPPQVIENSKSRRK